MTDRKKYPRSEWMEETKAKQNDWKKKNRSVLACDVSKEIGEKFKAYCKSKGKSVSSVLAEYVNSVLAADPENDTPGTVDNHPGFDTPGTVE